MYVKLELNDLHFVSVFINSPFSKYFSHCKSRQKHVQIRNMGVEENLLITLTHKQHIIFNQVTSLYDYC